MTSRVEFAVTALIGRDVEVHHRTQDRESANGSGKWGAKAELSQGILSNINLDGGDGDVALTVVNDPPRTAAGLESSGKATQPSGPQSLVVKGELWDKIVARGVDLTTVAQVGACGKGEEEKM